MRLFLPRQVVNFRVFMSMLITMFMFVLVHFSSVLMRMCMFEYVFMRMSMSLIRLMLVCVCLLLVLIFNHFTHLIDLHSQDVFYLIFSRLYSYIYIIYVINNFRSCDII